MFIQIHMLQSMPPGNLNRDETGQPKKCLFGGVTRGRISSQCLKRNIRRSPEFKAAFGDALADRTTYLPRMVADALKDGKNSVPDDERELLMTAIAARFKKEKRGGDSDEDGEGGDAGSSGEQEPGEQAGQTGQLVFFPPPFAVRIAELATKFRKDNPRAYDRFIGRKLQPKPAKDEEASIKAAIDNLVREIAAASQKLTVDIGLFGRMTTSDLVVNVEAACQVAHAMSTHEVIIESDYFTAMDDRKAEYVTSQTDKAGAAFMGTGETETFFDAAVYYKYLNVDLDALRRHLPSLGDAGAAKVAGTLVRAAALANPTGKQNSFASHSVPELILVEVSASRRPLSYANAFLQPVEGPNLLAQSSQALRAYVESVAPAFEPKDLQRFLLAVGHGKTVIDNTQSATTLEQLVAMVEKAITPSGKASR